MKSILLLSSMLIALSATSQTTTFKTNKWGNTKQTLDHDWATALDNPVKENVTIVETPTTFKATFGQKIKVYKIINSSKMDDDTKVYNTLMNAKPYIIKVMYISSDKTYAILCENEWAVANVTDAVTAH
jgi:hypothetical protein